MSSSPKKGIDRDGLDRDFAIQEAKKSELLLEAQLLRAQDRIEAAAASLAEAARIEETLSERCLTAGLKEKAWLHRFSAASCWAQAGNFYQAIAWCDDLLSQSPQHTEGFAECLHDACHHARSSGCVRQLADELRHRLHDRHGQRVPLPPA